MSAVGLEPLSGCDLDALSVGHAEIACEPFTHGGSLVGSDGDAEQGDPLVVVEKYRRRTAAFLVAVLRGGESEQAGENEVVPDAAQR